MEILFGIALFSAGVIVGVVGTLVAAALSVLGESR